MRVEEVPDIPIRIRKITVTKYKDLFILVLSCQHPCLVLGVWAISNNCYLYVCYLGFIIIIIIIRRSGINPTPPTVKDRDQKQKQSKMINY